MSRFRWKTWVRLAVSAALVALLLTQVDLGSVVRELSGINLLLFALAVIVGALAAMAAGLGWKSLLDAQGVSLPARDVLLVHMVGLFFAAFTPGGLGGDVLRTLRVRQTTRRTVEGGASVVASRVLSVVALLVASAAAAYGRPASELRTATLLAAAVAVVGVALLFALERPAGAALSRLPSAPWAAAVRTAARSMFAFRREPGHLAVAFGLLMLYQVLGAVVIAVIARSMNVSLGMLDAIALGLIARLTAFLPISISGIGVQEGAFVVLFGLVGVSPSQALAISLIDHVVLTVIPLAGGVLYAIGADARPAADAGPDAPADPLTGPSR